MSVDCVYNACVICMDYVILRGYTVYVSFCCYLGEQIITQTPRNCQPLVITLHTTQFLSQIPHK